MKKTTACDEPPCDVCPTVEDQLRDGDGLVFTLLQRLKNLLSKVRGTDNTDADRYTQFDSLSQGAGRLKDRADQCHFYLDMIEDALGRVPPVEKYPCVVPEPNNEAAICGKKSPGPRTVFSDPDCGMAGPPRVVTELERRIQEQIAEQAARHPARSNAPEVDATVRSIVQRLAQDLDQLRDCVLHR